MLLRHPVSNSSRMADYRLGGYVQRFPEPDDPQRSLRRGPGGVNIHLDLSYRYTDAGDLRTDAGHIAIVRYGKDGARQENRVPINETSADYRTHALLAALRFEF